MLKPKTSKQYDLEERTLIFAQKIRIFIKSVPKTISNIEDCKQLSRSSGSVGANYIEANHALSRRDFTHRIKICRKEAKESSYWLTLIDTNNDIDLEKQRQLLINEAIELVKIFSSIMQKSS